MSRDVDFDLFPLLWMCYVPQLTPIKILLAEDTEESLNEARSRLVGMGEDMRRINRKSILIDVLALLALVCQALGDEESALENLKTALALAEPGGWIRNFVDLGASMKDLLERLTQVQPEYKYAQQVLGVFKVEAQSKASAGRDAADRPGFPGEAPPILTQRETELLPLLSEGLSNKEIAARLYIAPETVKTHLQNIYRKLDAKGRMAALKAAHGLGLIPND